MLQFADTGRRTHSGNFDCKKSAENYAKLAGFSIREDGVVFREDVESTFVTRQIGNFWVWEMV